MRQTLPERESDPWLDEFADWLPAGCSVLDLGCGLGHDTLDLIAHGWQITALDRDVDRLRATRPTPGLCGQIVADLLDPLPFRDRSFDRVVASLSIHYFDAVTTERIVREIARLLRPDGALLARVNAVGDWNFGYGEGTEVEPGLFLLPDGRLKRFFSPESLRRFLTPCFNVERLDERAIHQHGLLKRTIETVARPRS